jgi:signal transduction histidine kinase
MFHRISLRPPVTSEASLRIELLLARKGALGRMVFGVVVGASSLLWLAPFWSAAYAAAIIFWEAAVRPWTTNRAVAALKDRRELLRLYQRIVILCGACLYSSAPLTGVLSHQLVGWYVALMAFCSAIIVGVTYFSNDKWQFSACTAPSFLVASSAPFLYDVAPHLAVIVTALNAMFIVSALHSALHRAELVESIAKEEAARSRAESANIEKSQFIANVSHELRTPLNAIIGYSEMLKETAEEDGRGDDRADLEKVLSASRRLLGTVNELLDVSKIEAGKLPLSVVWFDAAEMIDAAAASARPLIEANGGALIIDLAPDLGVGVSDEYRLNQCVANLLASAARLSEGETIKLDARRECANGVDWFVIAVSDASASISVAAIERLFDPFGQTDISLTGGPRSTGLGLAITRRVARLLGGDVTVESAPEAGSRLILRTPVIARVSTPTHLGDDEAIAALPTQVRAAG